MLEYLVFNYLPLLYKQHFRAVTMIVCDNKTKEMPITNSFPEEVETTYKSRWDFRSSSSRNTRYVECRATQHDGHCCNGVFNRDESTNFDDSTFTTYTRRFFDMNNCKRNYTLQQMKVFNVLWSFMKLAQLLITIKYYYEFPKFI